MTSMTLMAASCPVLTCRPCKDNKQKHMSIQAHGKGHCGLIKYAVHCYLNWGFFKGKKKSFSYSQYTHSKQVVNWFIN